MRFINTLLQLAPLASCALAVTNARLSTKVSDYGDRLILTLERAGEIRMDDTLVAESLNMVAYEYDLSSVDDMLSSSSTPVRLDPSSSAAVDTFYKLTETEDELTSLRVIVENQVQLNTQIALGLTPAPSGARDLALAVVVSSVRADKLIDEDTLQAEVSINHFGQITSMRVIGGNIGVTVDEPKVDGISCDGKNRYWCELVGLARSARQRAKNLISPLAAQTGRSTEEVENGRLNHKSHSKGGCAGKFGRRGRHHSHHRSHGGHNESATSLINGVMNALFNVVVPLLIGILTGTVVVLIAVGLADLFGMYMRSFEPESTIVLTEGSRISMDELAEYIESRSKEGARSSLDEKSSFEDDRDLESQPLMSGHH